jgi:hypothetical protein
MAIKKAAYSFFVVPYIVKVVLPQAFSAILAVFLQPSDIVFKNFFLILALKDAICIRSWGLIKAAIAATNLIVEV